MVRKIQSLVASAFFALIAATGANAATVTYINPDSSPAVQLTISDDDEGDVTPYSYQFSLTTGLGDTADYFALGFNFDGVLGEGDFSVVSAKNASGDPIDPIPELTLYGDGRTGGVSDCGPGCNLKGDGNSTLWDYIIKFGSQGGSGDNYVASIVFEIAFSDDAYVATFLASFSQFTVRAQSTSNIEGSIKADLEISPVPLPAGLPLLLSGLLAAGLLARRRAV